MSAPHILVAQLTAKPDQIEEVKARLLGMLEPTHAEAGCVQYDMHQDTANPAQFLVYEIWSTTEHWQAHMKTPHLLALLEFAETAMAEVKVSQLNRLNPS